MDRAQDKRLAWFDLDLSDKPYRALRYHARALRAVTVHRSYPLFASASDDGAVHVFHGMVYQVCRPMTRLPGTCWAAWHALQHMHIELAHAIRSLCTKAKAMFGLGRTVGAVFVQHC